jgi:hypothetical protein
MRVTQEGGNILLQDRPGPYWLLGLLLLFGGLLALAMSLGLASNAAELEPGERFGSMLVGLLVALGGLWWLARNPSTQVRLDLTRRRLGLVRIGITGRQVRTFPLDEIDGVEVEQAADSDGDPIWRPVLRTRSGERVALSELWSHDQREVKATVTVVAEVCPRLTHRTS